MGEADFTEKAGTGYSEMVVGVANVDRGVKVGGGAKKVEGGVMSLVPA
jgi:hypothetical protein